MYSRQEASQLRKNFWTSFGQYMRPLCSADDDQVKPIAIGWLNYKTGIKHLYFRMDVANRQAIIAIEFRHPDPIIQKHYFEKFRQLEKLFHQTMGETWRWQLHATDEDGRQVSRISNRLKDVNIFNVNDWSSIISFLKPRIMALDIFWNMVKEGFE